MHTTRHNREGLMLSMLLTTISDGQVRVEEIAEIARVASEEPEFAGTGEAEWDKLLGQSTQDLQLYPDKVLERIRRLLDTPAARRRGLELAARVVVADGLVHPSHVRVLEELADVLEINGGARRTIMARAHKRLAQFMIIYLVYLTAFSDGTVRTEEFEQMIPHALSMPFFAGISTAELRRIMGSVGSHLGDMKGRDGIDYICGTLLKAAVFLDDETLPEQAVRLVARGIMADGVPDPAEKEFFQQVADCLGVNVGQDRG